MARKWFWRTDYGFHIDNRWFFFTADVPARVYLLTIRRGWHRQLMLGGRDQAKQPGVVWSIPMPSNRALFWRVAWSHMPEMT